MTDENYSVKLDMDTESQLLETLCLEFDIDPALIRRLIELEIENERRMRRRGLTRSLRKEMEDYIVEREDDYPQD